jgi:hypothetical protein
MNTVVNLVLGLTGAGAVTAGLTSIRDGAAGVNSELAKGSVDALGLGKFVTMAGAAAGALYGLKAALNLGGELSDLSARTGQSVRDLVVLRQAFTAAGLGAESVGPTLNKVQKALGGVNEAGEDTIAAFKRLGVSLSSLKGMSGLQQIQELTKGFSQIEDPAERAATSMQIFGREGGQLLQLFSDSNALANAADDAGTLAEQMQANAKTFDDVGDRLEVIKVKLTSMAVSALERLMPVLNTAASAIKGLDLTGIGAVFGAALSILAPAGALAKMVSFLDNKVVDWTLKLGPGLVQNLGFSLSNLTGILAKLLPVGLGLAVGAAIIAGIEAAMIEADKREIEAANRRASKRHEEVVKLQGSRSMEEVAAKKAVYQKELDGLNALEKTQVLRPASTNVVANPAIPGMQSVVSTPEVRGLTEEQLQRQKDLQNLIKGADSEGIKKTVAANQEKDAAEARLKAAQAIAKVLHEQADTYAKQLSDLKYSLADDQTKLQLLDAQAVAANDQFMVDQAAAEAAKDEKAGAAALDKLHASILRIDQDRLAVEKSIEQTKKAAKEAEEKRLKAAQEARKASMDAAKLALENQKMEVDRKLSALDSDFTRSDAEKWSERRALLQQSAAAAEDYLRKIQEIRAAASSPEEKAILDQSVRAAGQDVVGATNAVGSMGPDPSSYADQVVASTTAAMNQLGTLQQQSARLWITTSDDIRRTMGSTLGDIALQGGSTRDKLAAASYSIYTSFVRNGAQMLVDWAWQHLVMANVRRVFETTATAEAAVGAGARGAIGAGETAVTAANVGAQVGIHAAGEGAKTGSSLLGTIGRKALMLGETIWHGIQVGIRTAAHFVGEVAKTAVSVAQWAIRLPLVLLETGYHLVLAGIKAMTAVASIPYVGPILAIAALAAVVAAGAKLMKKGFYDGGYTAQSSSDHTPFGDKYHANEWVAPAWQLRDKEDGPLIAYLEQKRRRRGLGTGNLRDGYSLGGFVARLISPNGFWGSTFNKHMSKLGAPRWLLEAGQHDEKNPFWNQAATRWMRDNGIMASNKPLEGYTWKNGEWVSTIGANGQALSSAGVISDTYTSASVSPSAGSSTLGASSGSAGGLGAASAPQPINVTIVTPDMKAQVLQAMASREGIKLVAEISRNTVSYVS